jgi:UDP-N-acetylmuramate dehydrogenase
MSWLNGLEHIVRTDEPLAPYCWLRMGGPARFLAEPTTREELLELVRRCQEDHIATRLLGGGSNLVVRDEGVDGLVIHLAAPAFGFIEVRDGQVRAGGGAKLAHVISSAVREGLAGIEALAGIPGTVGGALHGNAGSRTTDVGQHLQEATVLTHSGEVVTRTRDDMQFSYRQSSLNELVVLDARFQLEPEDPAELTRRLQKGWIVKRSNQPDGEIGTINLFKDSQGMAASEFIEQAGLKGTTVGGASLYERDPNFAIVNNATSDDVLRLVDRIRSQTAERTGVELETAFEVW